MGRLNFLCGRLKEVLGISADTSRDRKVSDLGLNNLCKLAGCTLSVQPANLHKIFLELKARHVSNLHVINL